MDVHKLRSTLKGGDTQPQRTETQQAMFARYAEQVDSIMERRLQALQTDWQHREECLAPILRFAWHLAQAGHVSSADYPGDVFDFPFVSIWPASTGPLIIVACLKLSPWIVNITATVGDGKVEQRFDEVDGYDAVYEFLARLVARIRAEEQFKAEKRVPPSQEQSAAQGADVLEVQKVFADAIQEGLAQGINSASTESVKPVAEHVLHDVIFARTFALADDEGNTRAQFFMNKDKEPILQLLDRNGTEVLRMATTEHGRPHIDLFDAGRACRLALCLGEDGDAMLAFMHPCGGTSPIMLRVDDKGEALIALRDERAIRAHIRLTPEGDIKMGAVDKDGKQLFSEDL